MFIHFFAFIIFSHKFVGHDFMTLLLAIVMRGRRKKESGRNYVHYVIHGCKKEGLEREVYL